jgi:hypothetical protein
MKLKMLISVFMMGSLAACSPSKGNATEGNTQSKTVLVNGESPEVYFKRFVYRISGKCSDQYGVHFHFLSTFEEYIVLPNAGDGSEQRGDLTLFLNEDGTYQADYVKMVRVEPILGGTRYRHLSSQRLSGRTHLNDAGELVVEGIGRLSALLFNEKPSAQLAVENQLLTEGIGDQQVIMSLVMSSRGLDHDNDMCQ